MKLSEDGNCPHCGSASVDVVEYDKDEDHYVYRCDEADCGKTFYYVDDDETWK